MRENSKRQHPASLHASGEDYLAAILILHMKKGTVRSVDVARHLGVSKPSVCIDFVLVTGDLTEEGDRSQTETVPTSLQHQMSTQSFHQSAIQDSHSS